MTVIIMCAPDFVIRIESDLKPAQARAKPGTPLSHCKSGQNM
ncbi:hypothetical protein [Aquicella siphonis]|nr:hypothetical protein [Aquicella siphonis]